MAMKLKESSFNIGKSIFIENLKRFWGIPALYSIMLFLTGAFPIMMAYDRLGKNGYHIVSRVLDNETFLSFLFLISAPLAAAVLIFRYLQQNNSVAVMHAFPLTRKKLYLVHCMTGIVLTMIPILVNGIILFIIKKPVYNGSLTPEDVFTASAILQWMWHSALISILGFSMAVFAGIITGSSVLQTIFGFGFLFLLPAFGALLMIYFEEFLFGFSSGRSVEKLITNLSPITAKLANTELLPNFIIGYIILTVIFFIFSYFLYLHRKLERSTDTITFDFLKPIFKYSVAFCGMSLLGMYFMQLSQDNKTLGLYIGFFIGSIIAYIIAEMIVQKTIWIFKNMKGYLIYLIIAAIFIVSIQTDIWGFEKRLPNLENIQSFYLGNYSDEHLENGTIKLLSATENIEAVYAFHQSIIENKKWLEKDTDNYTRNIVLNYFSEDGRLLTRQYQLPFEFFVHNPYIKEVYESEEYKISQNAIFDMELNELEYISLESNFLSNRNLKIIDPVEITEFCQAFKKDLLNESFEEMMNGSAPICDIDFIWKSELDNKKAREITQKYYSPALKKSYRHTINWLQSKGYLEQVSISTGDIKYITVEKSDDTYYSTKESINNSHLAVPVSTPDLMVITDAASIEKILNTLHNRYYKDDVRYNIHIVFKQGNIYSSFYYKDTLPAFITHYFESNTHKGV